MAVSKRTRYEVLRRDGHSCRYCGATAADSPLTVDHVVPVALGGADDPANLVAACRDCNAGKASTSPDSETVVAASETALRWADAIQQAATAEASKLTEAHDLYRYFIREWEARMPAFAALPHPDEWEQTVLKFWSLGIQGPLLDSAIAIAAQRTDVPHRARWKYFCGICWNKVRDLQDAAEQILADEDGGGDESPQPTAEEISTWNRAFDAGEQQGIEDCIQRNATHLASSRIVEAVVDRRLHTVPDELKWSA